MGKIVEEVENFYKIIALDSFRKTEGVNFDILKKGDIPEIASIDRVIHKGGAVSPGEIGNVERPWYMHPGQDDNLMVLYGTRYVDIYTKENGVEKFVVSPNQIEKNGIIVFEGAAMLVWPKRVFHRIVSDKKGSASINFAVRYKEFDIDTNFNIYDLNIDNGEYTVLREGFKDQF